MSETNVAHHKNEVHISGILLGPPEIERPRSGEDYGTATILTRTHGANEYHVCIFRGKLLEKIFEVPRDALVQIAGRLATRRGQFSSGQRCYQTGIIVSELAVVNAATPELEVQRAANGR